MEKLNITPPIIPFPPVEGGGVFGKVIKAVKWLFGLFKKPSKEVGESDSNDSLENIERITTIFIDFKEQVHAKAVEIEQAIQEEIGYYVEELHDILSYNDEKVLMYDIHINRISRQIDRISLRVEGVIDNELSKSISLDNFECREIMKMIPGSKKETAMWKGFGEMRRIHAFARHAGDLFRPRGASGRPAVRSAGRIEHFRTPLGSDRGGHVSGAEPESRRPGLRGGAGRLALPRFRARSLLLLRYGTHQPF